jgi:hypothetical protein
LTVWGEIIISLLPEGDNIKINPISTANADNIYAAFSSPNQKILNQFKNNFQQLGQNDQLRGFKSYLWH